jgi:hypothetical protein
MAYYYKIIDNKVQCAEWGEHDTPFWDDATELIMPNGVPDKTALWSDAAKIILDTPVEAPVDALRHRRDALLMQSEKENPGRGQTDRPWSQEWLDYRQELRDLPATATPTFASGRKWGERCRLEGVTWPTKPE